MNQIQARATVVELEQVVRQQEQYEPDTVHYFAPGLYAREMRQAAGYIVIGKIHRFSHITTISQGSAVVVTDRGRMELTAPCTFVSEAGDKRCIYALTDLVWTTYHPTEETDIEMIEKQVIAEDFISGPSKSEIEQLILEAKRLETGL